MPTVLLPVPHFEQSRDGTCLPACIRMILSHYGDDRTESDIAAQLGTKSFGTPIRHVERLRAGGYQVAVQPLTPSALKAQLVAGQPVIARVWTAMLDYWNSVTSHVVVVVGYDDSFVYLNDPSLTTAPQPVLWDAFLAAWAEYDETAVLLTPP